MFQNVEVNLMENKTYFLNHLMDEHCQNKFQQAIDNLKHEYNF